MATGNPITDAIGEALKHLLDEGRPLPYYAVAVGVNGFIMASDYRLDPDGDGLAAQMLAHHLPSGEDGARFPINIFIVSSDGEAAHIVINHDGKVEWD